MAVCCSSVIPFCILWLNETRRVTLKNSDTAFFFSVVRIVRVVRVRETNVVVILSKIHSLLHLFIIYSFIYSFIQIFLPKLGKLFKNA